MKAHKVTCDEDRLAFFSVAKRAYYGDPYWDSSSEDCARMLLNPSSAFARRADISAWIFYHSRDDKSPVARCILVRDYFAPQRCLVACFEALPSVRSLNEPSCIIQSIRDAFALSFPSASITETVFGLNGHLNHGAGYLLKPFDEAPLYDTPYTKSWYHELFSGFHRILLESYSFSLLDGVRFTANLSTVLYSRLEHARQKNNKETPMIRMYEPSHINDELALYTHLNNRCFAHHPFWTPRHEAEDRELFQTMFSSLENRHLLFAERGGKPVGFLAWFPDYNCASRDRCRLYEIAVVPEERNSEILPLLFCRFVQYAVEDGFTKCEGGFILQTNTASTVTARRYIERVIRFAHHNNTEIEPYRLLALYRKTADD